MTDETHELSVTRFIAAPPETVYRVWHERAREWFCPKPWTTPVIDFDMRPGGIARIVIRSPEGEETEHPGVFLEVVPNRRIVSTDAFKPDWRPSAPFMVAITTFEPEGAGTRYTARVRHWDAAALKQHEEMGFETGWGTCAAQLAELAEAEAAGREAA